MENYLQRCLTSLLEQTLSDIEIIAVDDGSPDRSGAICDAYAEKDSRIRVIHKQNGGVAAARNDGLAAATGEYVIFCDGDDWMPIDACENLWAARGADVIYGNLHRCWDRKEEYMRLFDAPFCTDDQAFIRELIKTNFYYTYCPAPATRDRADGCYGGPWNKLVRRSLLLEHDIRFDSRVRGVFDDVIYTAHVLANAKTVAYIGKSVYCYRQVGQSMTRGFKPDILSVNEQIFVCWEEFLSQHDPAGEFRQAYCANVLRRLDHAVQVYFLSEGSLAPRRQRLRELKTVMGSEPYRTAARTVPGRQLNRRHRVLRFMVAHRWAAGLWLILSVRKYLRFKHHG